MQHDDLKWRLDLMSRDMVQYDEVQWIREKINISFSMLIPLQDQRWLFVNWFYKSTLDC